MAGIVARRARRWLPDGSFFDGVGATPVGARLAGDGGLADAIAGKPGSYGDMGMA